MDFLTNTGEMGNKIRSKDWTKNPLGSIEKWPQSLKTSLSMVLRSPLPTVLLWGAEQVTFYNDAFATSFPAITEQTLGQQFEYVQPDLAPLQKVSPKVIHEFYHGNKTSQSISGQVTGYTHELTDMDIIISAVPGEEDNVTGVLITFYIQHKRELAASELKYRTLFDTMDQGFCIVEMLFEDGKAVDYRFLEVNPVFEKQAGLVNPEGKTAKELVPDLEDHWIKIYGRVAQTGEDIHLSQGSEAMGRWFDVYAFRHGGENSNRVAVLFSDVTRRKQAENALLQSEHQMRLITDAIPAFVTYVNTEEQYLFANKAYEDWFGIPREKIVGKKVSQIIDNERYLHIKPYVDRALAGEEVSFDNVLKKKDRIKYMQTLFIPDRSQDGSVRGFVSLGQDITEIKESQNALIQAQAQLRQTLASGDIDTWFVDIITQKVYGNERLAFFFGKDPKKATEGLPLEEYIRAIHPHDRDRVMEEINYAIETGENYDIEYRATGADKKMRWVVARGRVEYSSDGTPIGFMGALIDITKRKETETALQQSENQIRLITDALPVFISYVDADEKYQFVNSTYETWFRKQKNEVIGKTVREITGDKFYKGSAPYIRKVLQGEAVSFQNYFIRDGERRHLDLNYIPDLAESGEVRGFVILGHDITERKQAEETLRRTQMQLRNALASGDIDVWTYDIEKDRLSTGNRIPEVFGFSKELITTTGISLKEFTKAVHPEDLKKVVKSMSHSITTGDNYEIEYRLFDLNRKPHWVVARGKAEMTDRGPRSFTGVLLDITNRKNAEEKLRYLATITQNINDAVIGTDLALKIVSWNEGAEKLYGYKAPEIIGLSARKLFDLKYDDSVDMDRVFKSFRETGLWEGETWHKRKDGAYVPVLASMSYVKDEKGKPIGIVNVNRDITERRESEQAIRESEERFRLIARATNDVVWDWDLLTNKIWWNDAVYTLFGYKKEDVNDSAQWWIDTIHPDDKDRVENKIHHSIEQGDRSWTDEYRFRCADGSYADILDRGYIIHDKTGKSVRMLGSMLDLTERKRTEHALRDSEEFNRTLLESTPDCVIALNPEGKLLSINAQGQALLEIENFNKYKGTNWTNLWDEEHTGAVNSAVKIAKTGQIAHFQGFSATMKGTFRWWDVLVSPIYGAENDVRRLVAVARDITKIKKLEQQKDDFLGIASHELKTPVTSIKAYAQLLKNKFENENDALSAEMLEKMDGQLDRLTGLITDLLDVTKIEQGKLEFRMSDFSFNDLVQEVVEDVNRLSDRHEVEMQLDKKITVHGDRDRLGQVVTNFLINAIKYSPRADKVLVRTKIKQANEIVLSVQDFGVGLSEEDREKVFERFYRVEGIGYETYPGLGLGLYISAGIIHRHDGQIWVESEKGKGSTFYFSLPFRMGQKGYYIPPFMRH